mmetsp:Transcript_88848/g.147027  ORF Transcript_88848/g.147027 Transcript_88848/m.147027 type:complete len:432 (-) Transcript_88848:19-1314(-)
MLAAVGEEAAGLLCFLEAREVGISMRLSHAFLHAFTTEPVATCSRDARRNPKAEKSTRRLARVAHLKQGMAPELVDPSSVQSMELRTLMPFLDSSTCTEVHVESFPHCKKFFWHAPASLEAADDHGDFLEDDIEPPKLLGGDALEVDEGALRSATFCMNDDTFSSMKMQLRWFPEGNALCSREHGGCSLYLVAVGEGDGRPPSATFELRMGRLRRVLCHDFSSVPQWGCADFGDLGEAHSADEGQRDRVLLSVTILEAPARFTLRHVPSERDSATWTLHNWSEKAVFGPAAYASPPLKLPGCAEARLLVGLGPGSEDDLVGPGFPQRLAGAVSAADPVSGKTLRNVAAEPLAAFLSAPSGTCLRFALQAANQRRGFFHKFSFTAGFAGTRRLLEHAADAVEHGSDAAEVRVEILGTLPEGNEDVCEFLPCV